LLVETEKKKNNNAVEDKKVEDKQKRVSKLSVPKAAYSNMVKSSRRDLLSIQNNISQGRPSGRRPGQTYTEDMKSSDEVFSNFNMDWRQYLNLRTPKQFSKGYW
jgi:hypothetical protein